MADIHIEREHTLGLAAARKLADVILRVAGEFGCSF